MYPLCFRFFPHIGHHSVLSRVCCGIQQVLISHLLYVQEYICVQPNLPIYPSPTYPLVAINSFSASVTLLLFCK